MRAHAKNGMKRACYVCAIRKVMKAMKQKWFAVSFVRHIGAALLVVLLLTMTSGAVATGSNAFRIPILMYHHVIAGGAADCNTMTVTVNRLREDLFFLQKQGYTALLPRDLVKIRAGEEKMPQKPIMITFDDGYESNYTLAYPLLRASGMKATIALLVSKIRAPGQVPTGIPFLTWDECRTMSAGGLVEFGSHTYALHNLDHAGTPHENGHDGIQRLPQEKQDAYLARVGSDLHTSVMMIYRELGTYCRSFSYPFGACDPWFDSLLAREGISVTTTTVQRTANIWCGTKRLPRLRVTMDTHLADLLKNQ